MDNVVSLIHDPKFGIIFTNGEAWRIQRKTFVSLLRKTGFQKSHLESVIGHVWPKIKGSMTMASSFVVKVRGAMEQSSNEPLHEIDLALMELLVLTFSDKSVFPGRNVPRDFLKNFVTARSTGVQWIEKSLWYRYPILRHLAPHYSGFKWISDTMTMARKNLNEIVCFHKQHNNKNEKYGASYVDIYLKELVKTEDCDGHRALIASIESFIFGASNQSIALYSLLYCLARNPDVQDNMRTEIRGALSIGKDKFVLSYCWAVILETLRYIPQLGLGAPHQTREDIVVDGYKIPRGIDIYPDVIGNLWSEEHWNRPETFQPQRFLDKGGCFNHEVQS